MTINPIAFAQDVNRQFLRYQLTAFPLSDPDMAEQAKTMLGGEDQGSQLVKGPFVSLSRSFKQGKVLNDLVKEGRLHPAVAGIAEHPVMFAHQQAAFDIIMKGSHCLVSTGTGSGKTEAFPLSYPGSLFQAKGYERPERYRRHSGLSHECAGYRPARTSAGAARRNGHLIRPIRRFYA